MPLLLEGKKISLAIQDEIADAIRKLVLEGGRPPHLAAVLLGHDGASETYVRSKMKLCEKTGMHSSLLRMEAQTSEQELLETVHALNRDTTVDGFIVQLPLPAHISVQAIISAIDPAKDVDGFHPENLGRIQSGMPAHIPATPLGILTLLSRYQIKTDGASCVILGRSSIVGTPLSMLLSRNADPGNCTVTLCHSHTRNIAAIARGADILVAAMGRPHFVTADMVKKGAVVIDVGITRVPADNAKGYVIRGDVDFDSVAPLCSAITPVPGGVGVMTVVSLLMNTLNAAVNSQNRE